MGIDSLSVKYLFFILSILIKDALTDKVTSGQVPERGKGKSPVRMSEKSTLDKL